MKYGTLHRTKIYWSTKEVVEMTGIPAYTLRYWERVVPFLQIARNRAKNRAWQKKEIDFVTALKSLLENQEQPKAIAEAANEVRDISQTPAAEDTEESQNPNQPRETVPDLPAVPPPDSQMDLFDSPLPENNQTSSGIIAPPIQTLPPSMPTEAHSADSSSPVRGAQPGHRHPDPAVLLNLRAELIDAIARLKASPEKP